jgi:putative hemolysin
VEYLRFRTYLLAGRRSANRKIRRRLIGFRRKTSVEPVAARESPEQVAAEIESLPAEQLLTENDAYAVYAAQSDQIPHALREVGRLREITFREEGEGTGKALDIDRFDRYYVHLILWSKTGREVAGAYRLAKTDEVLRYHGKRGLYTSTLFRFGGKLLRQIGPALELGRSFIRREHQRNYSSLLLLWRGIGTLIAREPRYRSLFGPVSINNNYQSVSRRLMVAFLKLNHNEPDLMRIIRSRNPVRAKPVMPGQDLALSQAVTDIDDVSELIGEIEDQQQGVPILLRQYLKLGAKLLGFNLDPDFSDVLDGLVWVDLTKTDPKMLRRFMGKENADTFLAYQAKTGGAVP